MILNNNLVKAPFLSALKLKFSLSLSWIITNVFRPLKRPKNLGSAITSLNRLNPEAILPKNFFILNRDLRYRELLKDRMTQVLLDDLFQLASYLPRKQCGLF